MKLQQEELSDLRERLKKFLVGLNLKTDSGIDIFLTNISFTVKKSYSSDDTFIYCVYAIATTDITKEDFIINRLVGNNEDTSIKLLYPTIDVPDTDFILHFMNGQAETIDNKTSKTISRYILYFAVANRGEVISSSVF